MAGDKVVYEFKVGQHVWLMGGKGINGGVLMVVEKQTGDAGLPTYTLKPADGEGVTITGVSEFSLLHYFGDGYGT